MTYLILRIMINAMAIAIAVKLVDGITFTGEWWKMIFIGIVFGVVNSIIKPLLTFYVAPDYSDPGPFYPDHKYANAFAYRTTLRTVRTWAPDKRFLAGLLGGLDREHSKYDPVVADRSQEHQILRKQKGPNLGDYACWQLF
jgi:hypothetical protein